MRSSKSRSRSKSNRNRSMGNVVNRVFDSSGPEGKVRGTPQQIIDKYNQLARDAQLSNDRVATENFQQHAEHYLRMLAEAQKEQAERQAQQQANQERQQQQRNQNNNNNNSGNAQNDGQPRQPQADQGAAPQPEVKAQSDAPKQSEDVMDMSGGDSESPLVETPENRQPRQRKPRKKPEPEPQAEVAEQPTPDAAE